MILSHWKHWTYALCIRRLTGFSSDWRPLLWGFSSGLEGLTRPQWTGRRFQVVPQWWRMPHWTRGRTPVGFTCIYPGKASLLVPGRCQLVPQYRWKCSFKGCKCPSRGRQGPWWHCWWRWQGRSSWEAAWCTHRRVPWMKCCGLSQGELFARRTGLQVCTMEMVA